jgi:predicted PolB exonuclease-like 3'-5' exonuclease
MTKLYFDIETIPVAQEKMQLMQRLYEDKLAKDRRIAEQYPDFDEYYKRTALNGAFGQLFCIGVIKEKDGIETVNRVIIGPEKGMLEAFWELSNDVQLFIGHGVRFFDFKFLMQRSIIHGVSYRKISMYKFADNPIYDTMDQWMCYDGTISLHELAIALGIPSPKESGIDGSQVYDFYLAGKTQDICDYCERDVATVRSVYRRLTAVRPK